MSEGAWFTMRRGKGPVVATAIHAGHETRAEVEALFALDAPERRREEDPYTDLLTAIAPTRVVSHRSRFEVDLNRPRSGAIYLTPEDAWGLEVWQAPPGEKILSGSLAIYDAFYSAMRALLADLVARHGRFVVLDLHSYNHRREGPDAAPADPAENPEINVGTGSLPRQRWAPLVDGFIATLAAAGTDGRPLDVRENVRFRGGHFSRWVHETFPETGCCLAVEFKKTFMDEWSGELDEAAMPQLEAALAATVPRLREELGR